MSELVQRFAVAQARAQVQIEPITGLDNAMLLELDARYEQATVGDVSGSRPGMLDLRGR